MKMELMQAAKTTSLFKDRSALLVTKHGKERVIAPVLKQALGLDVVVCDTVDTDLFGTFSGEVERPASQYNTAKLKASRVFELNPDAEIVIASEGAFNPHPDCPFIPVNTEIVLLLDRRNELEMAGRYLSFAVHLKEGTVSSPKEAKQFAKVCGFPGCGIILSTDGVDGGKPFINKDINTAPSLEAALLFLFSVSATGRVKMQTDMRAHFNPARMGNIKLAAFDLARVAQSICPVCSTPGFDVKETVRGLPCGQCGGATRTFLSYWYECKKCSYRLEKLFPQGKTVENPMFCDYCNP